MYKRLFDEEKQNHMRNFFLNTVAPLGKEIHIHKNEVFTTKLENYVGIITKGKVNQALYHSNGAEKILFFLIPGEIFGETNYFVEGGYNLQTRAMEDSVISIVEKNILDEFLASNAEGYRYFIHSITRKYRISLSQMSDILFTSSKSKIANTLYRLAIQGVNVNLNGKIIFDISFTHQELADLIGCSRVTVTKILNELIQDGIISIQNKKVTIKDLKRLEEMVEY